MCQARDVFQLVAGDGCGSAILIVAMIGSNLAVGHTMFFHLSRVRLCMRCPRMGSRMNSRRPSSTERRWLSQLRSRFFIAQPEDQREGIQIRSVRLPTTVVQCLRDLGASPDRIMQSTPVMEIRRFLAGRLQVRLPMPMDTHGLPQRRRHRFQVFHFCEVRSRLPQLRMGFR